MIVTVILFERDFFNIKILKELFKFAIHLNLNFPLNQSHSVIVENVL